MNSNTQPMIKKLWDVINPFVAILLCMLAGTMIGTMGFGLVTGIRGISNDDILVLFPWLSLVISLISFVLTVFVLRHALSFEQVRFGYERYEWKPVDYACAIFGVAAVAHIWSSLIYMSGIQKIFTGYQEGAGRAFEGQNMLLLFATTVIAAPIAEELVFRFLIYKRAKYYFGKVTGCIISALLFGIYHANMVQFIYVIGLTVLLVLLYEKSGNILAPILGHAGANLYALILDQLIPKNAATLYLQLAVPELIIAVLACIYFVRKKQ